MSFADKRRPSYDDAAALSIAPANEDDLPFVMSLMRSNRESVGGLPRPAILERVLRRTVLLARLNGEPCGYLLYDHQAGTVRIPQACIQYDARRRKYGEALVRVLLETTTPDEVRVRCAADLEANIFWRDMGFTCVGTSPGGRRRGRTINAWNLWLTPRLIGIEEISVVPAAEIRQDSMYDETQFLREAPGGFRDAVVLPKIAWANWTPDMQGRPLAEPTTTEAP